MVWNAGKTNALLLKLDSALKEKLRQGRWDSDQAEASFST
jgi:hypothetical protein